MQEYWLHICIAKTNSHSLRVREANRSQECRLPSGQYNLFLETNDRKRRTSSEPKLPLSPRVLKGKLVNPAKIKESIAEAKFVNNTSEDVRLLTAFYAQQLQAIHSQKSGGQT